jgi:(2R)-3-sulfolactate dehydrogenase (NADP+)
MADSTARALVLAESQGLGSHGLSRVAQYATHLRNGRVNGAAVPRCCAARAARCWSTRRKAWPSRPASWRCARPWPPRDQGVAFAGVVRSHHCGVVVDHLRPVAAAGMVGLGFANSPAAMPAAGGRHPIFGTNPVAAVFPRRAADPLMIDLSLSEVARGKLMVAAKEGKPIPKGLGARRRRPAHHRPAGRAGRLDAADRRGVVQPKGAMLALVVELLVTALIGANFGFEASSFFVDEGNRPRIGQAFIVIDPGALAGATPTSTASRCWSPRCCATTACACPARGARRCAAEMASKWPTDGIEHHRARAQGAAPCCCLPPWPGPRPTTRRPAARSATSCRSRRAG